MQRTKKITVALILIMVMATTNVSAAGLGRVTSIKGHSTLNTITLSWSKVKGAKGYSLVTYNSKSKKWVEVKKINGKTTYKHLKLKPSTTYKYKVRPFTTYKVKQYYNSKSKKWVTKKPVTKQWKGKKSRYITAYRYGAYSKVYNFKTKANKTTVKKDSKFKVSMWNSEYDIADGSSITISAHSSGKISWASSNTAVATVKANGTKGIVTLKKAGKTTITATNYDGQKKSVVFTVTYTPPTPTSSTAGKIYCKYYDVWITPTYASTSDADVIRVYNTLLATDGSKGNFLEIGESSSVYEIPVAIAKKYIDLSAPMKQRVNQVWDATIHYLVELAREGQPRYVLDNCGVRANINRIMFSYANIPCEANMCRDDAALIGDKAFKEFYDDKNTFYNHLNNIITVDGHRYIYDMVCGIWDIDNARGYSCVGLK